MFLKSSKINEEYQTVMRAAIMSRAQNPQHAIEDLLEKPTFSGFVEVSFLKDISVCMFVCRNDDGIALRCLWNGSFEPFSLAIWSVLARNSNCVIDVGAHSGIYSLFAHAVNPLAEILSFEPFPVNYARLSLNLRSNQFRDHMALNLAISNMEGIVPFSGSANSWYLSAGGSISSQQNANTIPATCTTLDKIVVGNDIKPQLIKMDVEGHELQVLQGCPRVLKDNSPDIIIESVFNQNTRDIESILKQRGYRFYVIQDDNLALEEVEHLRPSSSQGINMDQCNRLITKRSSDEIADIEASAQSLFL